MDLARSHYVLLTRGRRVILKDAGGVVVIIITILWITIQYLAPMIFHAPVTRRVAILARTSTHLGPPAKLAQVADTKTKLGGHHAKSTLTTVVLVFLLLLIKNHAYNVQQEDTMTSMDN